ncbi:MAG TPA: calcium/proton exchanger [Myxococcales bacterium]|nr:calcium/proton exchanger [Myxococcales bacterium]
MTRWFWRALWLLLPAAWLVHRYAQRPALAFFIACASLIPLAKTMGDATEALAGRMGPAPGSLLNAAFGNAAELILGFAALRHGHIALVKGSITGSILGNLLLVAGGSIVVGGAHFSRLRFNKLAASSSVATLFLAVVAMIVPTLVPRGPHTQALSEGIAAVLIVMYALSLFFSLRTHAEQMAAVGLLEEEEEPSKTRVLRHDPTWLELARLGLAAAATAVASELLVDSLGPALSALHLPETFAGVIVVAIVGNAAEHSTALLFARRGQMDVALGIAWESSKQIALFVAPLLVLASVWFGAPMDLAFTRLEVAALGLGVIALALIALDGETHWLEGAFLLAVYLVLGMGFYFVG